MRFGVALSCIGVVIGLADLASAYVLRVPSDAPSIAIALDYVSDDDTILVDSPGTFPGPGYCGKAVTLKSKYGPKFTTLVGDQYDGFLWISPPDYGYTNAFRLQGFSIRCDSLSFDAIHSWYMNLEVIDCVFLNTLGPAIHMYGRTLTVRGCRFFDDSTQPSASEAISIGGQGAPGNLVLERSVFYKLEYQAVSVSGTVRAINNVFMDCPWGIYALDGSVTALNNIFMNSTGVALRTGSGPVVEDYNLFFMNAYDIYPGSVGPHSISADPLLANPIAGDFSPLTGSPCIDAGHPDNAYNDPDRSRNDIGAVPFSCSLFDFACDPDGDELPNPTDNCPYIANPDQADTNGNGIGDVCECDCSCHADLLCDGMRNVCDVVALVGIVLRNAPANLTPTCPLVGPGEFKRADVDCSGETDIVDLILLIDVTFRSANPSRLICDPCALTARGAG